MIEKIKPKLYSKRMNGNEDSFDEDQGADPTNKLFGLDDLCKDFLKKDSKVLELGSNDGVSTSLFAYYADEVVAVDINRTSKMDKVLSQNSNIKFIHGNIYTYVPLLENNYFDLIYIDADHWLHSVIKDIEVSFPKLKNGGIMAGHDYYEYDKGKETVYEAVNIIFRNRNIKTYSDSSWAVDMSNGKS